MRLTWTGLGDPFCFALPPDKSATGKHHSRALFVGCQGAKDGEGRTLAGKPIPREIAEHTITTVMLAFSETWIRAPEATRLQRLQARLDLRRGASRNGGSESFSPSVSSGSSAAKPGPSVAISNRMPFGSRK